MLRQSTGSQVVDVDCALALDDVALQASFEKLLGVCDPANVLALCGIWWWWWRQIANSSFFCVCAGRSWLTGMIRGTLMSIARAG